MTQPKPWQEFYEVRIGLVLFGGVALAVYMNGVMQELLQFVRASQRHDEKHAYGRLLKAAKAKLMIDVIAGTSAGGLNGLILAKALATGSDEVKGLSQLWKSEAQMDKLVQTTDPHAILSDEIMETNLLNVMRALTKTGDPELAKKVPVLDLFVTATDLGGQTVEFEDMFKQKIVQTRNQHTFHFKKRSVLDENGIARGYEQNDFLGKDSDPKKSDARDRLFTAVGRATSAFPGALPPRCITREDAKEADLEEVLPAGERKEFWFSDGGILMNKPFKPVVQTIFERSATCPVERVLVFLDPDPKSKQEQTEKGEPHILQVIAAPLTMPSNEDVVGYLERVKKQSQYRKKLLWGFAQAEHTLQHGRARTAGAGALDAYRLMRANQALWKLEQNFRSTLKVTADQDPRVELLLNAIKKRMGLDHEIWNPQDLDKRLEPWDSGYHIRRLHYLLLHFEQAVEAFATAHPGPYKERIATLAEVRTKLWNALEDWRNAEWVTANGCKQTVPPDVRKRFDDLMKSQFEPTPDQIANAVTALADYLEVSRTQARKEEQAAFALLARPVKGAPWPEAIGELGAISDGFESRDLLILPMLQYSEMPEWDAVDIMEIAPGPTPHINRGAHERLASETLGHFGGFFSQRWRQNDIMWGRIDAAELMAKLMVEEAKKHITDPKELNQLDEAYELCIQQRHREILVEEAAIVDLRKLEQRYDLMRKALIDMSGRPEAVILQPVREWLSGNMSERDVGAFWNTFRQAAAASQHSLSDYPEGLKGKDLIKRAPMDVLWAYLAYDHNIGEETVASLPASVFTTSLQKGLDNLACTLDRDTGGLPGAAKWMRDRIVTALTPVRWATKILLPGPGALGLLAWPAGVGGVLLISLHLLGVLTLDPTGWTVAVGLIAAAAVLASFFKVVRTAAVLLLCLLAAFALAYGLSLAAVNVRAPFQFLPAGAAQVAGWALAGLAVGAYALMELLGHVPRRGKRPGILDLELAGSPEEVARLLQFWQREDPKATVRATFQIGADFLFIVGYAALLALLTGWGGTVLGDRVWAPLAAAGAVVAWLQLLAGLLDITENVGMMQALLGSEARLWPRLARVCAWAKFSLIGLAAPFVLAWLINLGLQWFGR